MKHIPLKAIVVSLVVLLAIGGGYYYYRHGNDSQKDSPKTSPTTIKDRPIGETDYGQPSKEQENPTLDHNTPNQPENPQASQGKPIPVVISYAGGSPLQVRVVVSEILPSGTCTLTLQKSGSPTISQKADVFPTASSTTCKGFAVDTSSLPKGNYKITVKVEAGDRSGSASSNVTI